MAVSGGRTLIPITALIASVLCAVLLLQQVESAYQRPKEVQTERPVIGIVTIPEAGCLHFGDQVVVSSNARWLQAGGTRVVPIFYDSTPEELDYILNRVNGVFWSGGPVFFNPHTESHSGSLRTTEYILKHVMRENRRGNYFPLWGTCLGFERMVQLVAEDAEASIVKPVDAENYAINLGFTDVAFESRLFRSMNAELFKEVASPATRLAFNNHGLGIHPDYFHNITNLSRHFSVLSVDLDRHGKPFVSTVEGKRYPLYGSQWHPEKPPWEWSPDWVLSHTNMAIQLSNYFGRFFVEECRYNKNKFESPELEDKLLLHNWNTIPASAILSIDPTVFIPFMEYYCIDRSKVPSYDFITKRSKQVSSA
uniref:folate gamma-glutamyl hydrolase n=1 Tax=Physcomitrium patens TaxID=3218 RepID=A0A7I4BJF9_PHYPA